MFPIYHEDSRTSFAISFAAFGVDPGLGTCSASLGTSPPAGRDSAGFSPCGGAGVNGAPAAVSGCSSDMVRGWFYYYYGGGSYGCCSAPPICCAVLLRAPCGVFVGVPCLGRPLLATGAPRLCDPGLRRPPLCEVEVEQEQSCFAFAALPAQPRFLSFFSSSFFSFFFYIAGFGSPAPFPRLDVGSFF